MQVSVTDLLNTPPVPAVSSSDQNDDMPMTPTMPSPFKRCLMYPSPTSLKKKFKLREPTPVAVTGESYKLYIRKKEEKKKQIEKEKEQRRLIRETKKNIKKENIGTKKRQIQCVQNNDSSTTDEDDNEPTPVEPKDLESLSVNSWVVVPYIVDGRKQFFPGQIKVLKENSAGIKFLTRRGNKFSWPEEEDFDDDVPLTEIVQILSPPSIERRGFFSFKEKVMA